MAYGLEGNKLNPGQKQTTGLIFSLSLWLKGTREQRCPFFCLKREETLKQTKTWLIRKDEETNKLLYLYQLLVFSYLREPNRLLNSQGRSNMSKGEVLIT